MVVLSKPGSLPVVSMRYVLMMINATNGIMKMVSCLRKLSYLKSTRSTRIFTTKYVRRHVKELVSPFIFVFLRRYCYSLVLII